MPIRTVQSRLFRPVTRAELERTSAFRADVKLLAGWADCHPVALFEEMRARPSNSRNSDHTSQDDEQTVKTSEQRNICHVITGLSMGGAEIMLWKLLLGMREGRWSAHVLSLLDVERR